MTLDRTRDPKGAGFDWDFDGLQRAYDKVSDIALGELKLDIYPNQIEVITSEQMLDAYSSIGMPLMYKHWSFGKHFARDELLYRHGLRNLAYEIVINSNPCIAYLMEENSMMMQTLVIAHAAFGHNHFFKNNNLFRQWTDANGILDYLEFAKSYIARCEDKYGEAEVEKVLDAAHALMAQGVNRYPRKKAFDLRDEEKRARERAEEAERSHNELWRTLPRSGTKPQQNATEAERRKLLGLPEENVLYFLEKTAPALKTWQREIIRIVRQIAQYFYPQKQTKMMNEGCATFVHYHVMNRLHDIGFLNDGAMLEFLHSHTGAVFQPEFDHRGYSGINPYALGFGMMQDIQRVCTEPTDEDREWLPEIAGQGDWVEVLKDAWANHRDESFIRQFLSPELIRKMKFFNVYDDSVSDLIVKAIHNEQGYQTVRTKLANQFDVVSMEPEIEIVDVDLYGDRKLMLQHRAHSGIVLDEKETAYVLQHLADLWGYEVMLIEIAAQSDAVLKEHRASPSGAVASN
ncbi:MAG TPA: SpoVR family protein [Alphaproteobacteria bacterium]|nr:SpoVR family protein [Alphaproteobacteria bacterium]